MLQEIQTVVIPYLVNHKDLIVELLGGAAGISVLAQSVLHKLDGQLNKISATKRKVYSFVLAQLLTAIAALATYIFTNVNLDELYPWLATLVTAVHQLAVNPYYTKKILPFLEFQASQKVDTTTTDDSRVAEAPVAGVGFVS